MQQEPLSAGTAGVVAAVVLAAVVEGPDPEPLGPRSTRGTIVVVDDDRVLRMLLGRFLTLEGYLAFEAAHGLEALEIAKRRRARVDLLVTDVIMPLMSGFDLAEAFLTMHPETRVLFMSGHVDDVPRVGKAAQANPETFMSKPFWSEQFLERVRAILRGPDLAGRS